MKRFCSSQPSHPCVVSFLHPISCSPTQTTATLSNIQLQLPLSNLVLKDPPPQPSCGYGQRTMCWRGLNCGGRGRPTLRGQGLTQWPSSLHLNSSGIPWYPQAYVLGTPWNTHQSRVIQVRWQPSEENLKWWRRNQGAQHQQEINFIFKSKGPEQIRRLLPLAGKLRWWPM